MNYFEWGLALLSPASCLRELVVSVTGEEGEPRRGLSLADFAVVEDGVKKEIIGVVPEERFPVRLGVLMHYSRDNLSALRGHFRFLRELFLQPKKQVEDSLFLSAYGPEFASVGYRELSIDSSDRFGELLGLYAEAKYLPEFLHGTGDGKGGTRLSDAVEHACTKLKARPASQGALIVIDPPPGMGAVFEQSGVPIYPVSLAEAGDTSQGICGGALSARNKEEIRDLQSQIFRDLRSGYRVRYVATTGCNRIEVLARGVASVRLAGMHGAIVA